MRILMVGGGSGGHVTPLKAVADEVKLLSADTEILVVTDRKFAPQAEKILGTDLKIRKIQAGKLRRYSSKSALWHVLHLPTLLKNIRDIFYLMIGFFQSLKLIANFKPDVIFSKGGFVSVPVGYAARCLGKKIIIHDSDTHPGLASRMLAKYASKIATGMPTKYYQYAQNKMVYTGIPVSKKFQPVGEGSRVAFLKSLHLDQKRPLLLLTGGGMGAQQLNEALEAIGERLIVAGWQIVEVTGKGKQKSALEARKKIPLKFQAYWHVEEFVDLAPYILASSISVVRTGATTMQELANSQKVAITIPSRHLADQNKNAQMFKEHESAVVIAEPDITDKPDTLLKAVEETYSDKKLSTALAQNLYANFSKPKAAKQLAQLLLRGD